MRERKSRTKGWADTGEARARRRQAYVAQRREELVKGKCGLTGKPCAKERWCEYGSSAVPVGRGAPTRRKIEACAVAIERGYSHCKECLGRNRCGEVWRCFRKESPAKELLEESGVLRRAKGRSAAKRRVTA